MNRAVPLSKLIEEAAYLQDENTKNAAGSITDPDTFMRNAPALELLHKGLFSFLAFHPRVDQAVAEYVLGGSIASDSGPKILVLFFSGADTRFPRTITKEDLNVGLELDVTVHPAYRLAQWLLPAGTLPRFPGLILADRLVGPVETVYVPIATHSSAAEVADFCRSVFVLADRTARSTEPGKAVSLDAVSVALKANGFEYSRSGHASAGEWLITAYEFGKKHGATIASLVSKIVKLV